MAVNLKLGVELGDFQQNINTAKAQIKEFDAALKQAESRFKATGDAESAMATKTSQLTAKFQAQKRMVDEYRQALQKADEGGVSKLNAEYIKLQTQLLNAEAAMYDTQTALQGLSMSEQQAAQGADTLTKSVNGIGKKISLDQVISGIDKITGGLENAARRAVQLGEQLWDMIMDSAQRASDQAEMAQMYNIPLQRYKQMLGLEAEGLKTTTDAILSSQKKLNSNIGKGSTATLDTLQELGLLFETGKGAETFITTDTVRMFWEAGQALMGLEESFDKEAAAQSLFGRSWNELVPLFQQYKSLEEYEKALDGVNVTSETATENLDTLGDRVGALEHTWTSLKDEILQAVAPGLTGAADALNGVLSTILEYLQKPEGQEMLEKLGTAVSGLFEDLKNIDPQEVISGFTGVFNTVIDSMKWLDEHKNDVVKALEYIVGGWALLKLTGGALQILDLINGVKGLKNSGMVETGTPITDTTTKTGGGKNNFFGNLLSNVGAMVVIDYDPLQSLEYKKEYGKLGWAKYIDEMYGTNLFDLTNGWIEEGGGKTGVEVPVEPKTDEEAAAEIAAQIGVVNVPVKLVIQGGNGSSGPSFGGGAAGGGGMMDYYWETVWGGFRPGYANGIPWVPDTRLAWLHPGERVMTASQNRSYTANSNLYIENMNMGGGMDARALADALSAQNRRISAGFGS